MKRLVIFTLILLSVCFEVKTQTRVIAFTSPWLLREAGSEKWYFAKVPGNVYRDLAESHLIKEPYQTHREEELQWVAEKTWEYKTSFMVDQTVLRNKHVEICFEGLDTYATVRVNDSLVLRSNNMFVEWTADIKKFLKNGTNKLVVSFSPALEHDRKAAAALPYTLPEGERVFSRKAQFQYGWDFSPKLIGCGIWKPVTLRCWNNVNIESLRYRVQHLDDSLATVTFYSELRCDSAGNYPSSIQSLFSPKTRHLAVKSEKLSALKVGLNIDSLQVQIKRPQKWWCNGWGEAYLYQFRYLVSDQNNKALDKKQLAVGLRTLELVRERDSAGVSFFFKLNGKALYCKGANVVPQDALLPGLQADKLQKLVLQAKASHMNMLRVWGGGVYASDEFYSTCDRLGILVWQDFMFACAMYPGDKDFLNSVKQEITQQVLRVSSHPCLALWCGNNESNEGWFNWGWQKQHNLKANDSLRILQDYRRLFEEMIPNVVKQYAPQTAYLSSSPVFGWGRQQSLREGDSHYWGVWWGMEPFGNYRQKTGRFVSEFGFQSMPDKNCFNGVVPSSALHVDSAALRVHQKHKTGFETMQTYLEREYRTSSSFEKQVYLSQLVQRDGMKIAIEAQRSAKPRCMGSLFWQLNDSWPSISWSAYDYSLQPKALSYATSALYKTCLISARKEKETIKIHLVSDSLLSFEAVLDFHLRNFKGEELWKQSLEIACEANGNGAFEINCEEWPKFDTTAVGLCMELRKGLKVIATNRFYFAAAKHLKLPPVLLNIEKLDETSFRISSKTIARDIFLYTDEKALHLSDNFFTLDAGESRVIRIQNVGTEATPPTLKYLVLNNL